MKKNIQFTPELTAALLCAAGFFAIWLFGFSLLPQAGYCRPRRAELTRLVADEKTLDKLKAPTLFALPSETGFSGRFIRNRVDRPAATDKPVPAERFLAMTPPAVPVLDPEQLSEQAISIPDALPVPGARPQTAPVRETGTQLFFSPELKPRAPARLPDGLAEIPFQEPVRANLSVRADGTVESVFFDTPVTNAALIRAVRHMTFRPAKSPSDGWIDIRFAQGGAR